MCKNSVYFSAPVKLPDLRVFPLFICSGEDTTAVAKSPHLYMFKFNSLRKFEGFGHAVF